MLAFEIRKCLDKEEFDKGGVLYFNEFLGDTSFLLATLLQRQLENSAPDWDSKRWVDDSLIEKCVTKNGNRIGIGGVIIWGLENSTKQWTDPFYFESEFTEDKTDFSWYTFLFCDLDSEGISYEEINLNRSYWNFKKRNWRYILNSKFE